MFFCLIETDKMYTIRRVTLEISEKYVQSDQQLYAAKFHIPGVTFSVRYRNILNNYHCTKNV